MVEPINSPPQGLSAQVISVLLSGIATGKMVYVSAPNVLSALTPNTGLSIAGGNLNVGGLTNSEIANAAAIAYSKLALSGSIVNTDISNSAAIAYAKLALSNSIVNADISSSAAIAYAKLALANSIVNADISASASIAKSKISTSSTWAKTDQNASTAYIDAHNDFTGYQDIDMEGSAPSAPSTSKMRVWGRSDGRFPHWAYTDELNMTYAMGPDTWRFRRPMILSVNAGQLQGTGFMQPALAASATFSAATVDANGPKRIHTSAASANAQAGWDNFGAPCTRRDLNFDLTFKFAVVTSTNIRARVGLAASTTMAAAANASVEHVDLRLDTGASNTNFCITNSDGANEDITQVLAADTAMHTIRFIADNANTRILYSLDGANPSILTTHIPGATTALCAYCEVRTLNSAATDWDFRWVEGYQDK
nr:hypothetical protein [uncultured Nitrososphaera sp.]